MGGWRKKGDAFDYQQVQRSRRNHREPPTRFWRPKVPSWEKQFCASIGSISWDELLENKRYMFLYQNVVQWNDSAGEEAFNDAKKRYWANINGLPCDISLPDPNTYIDEIDWNPDIDPKLLLELDQEPEEFPMDKDREAVILDLTLPMGEFACMGWGDTDENFKKPKVEQNPWEGNEWGNVPNNSLGLNSWKKNTDVCHNSWEDNRGKTPQDVDKNSWEENDCNGSLGSWEKNINACQTSWENNGVGSAWNADKNPGEGNGWVGSLGSWEENINACQTCH